MAGNVQDLVRHMRFEGGNAVTFKHMLWPEGNKILRGSLDPKRARI